ncbi:hypothetical protein AK812_SmicGene12556, partial [Symbiodinium microadriaticum]
DPGLNRSSSAKQMAGVRAVNTTKDISRKGTMAIRNRSLFRTSSVSGGRKMPRGKTRSRRSGTGWTSQDGETEVDSEEEQDAAIADKSEQLRQDLERLLRRSSLSSATREQVRLVVALLDHIGSTEEELRKLKEKDAANELRISQTFATLCRAYEATRHLDKSRSRQQVNTDTEAAIALRAQDSSQIAAAQQLVTKALWLHREAEKEDLVMRAKIWHSVGECSFALGFLAEGGRYTDASCTPATAAEAIESAMLFRKTEGRLNPLTGQEAQYVAWALLKLKQPEEAKSYLLESLEALAEQQSGWGDGDVQAPALMSSVHAVDRILEAHRRSDDRAGLVRYFPGLQRLCANVAGRLQPSKDQQHAVLYERLLSSSSLVRSPVIKIVLARAFG